MQELHDCLINIISIVNYKALDPRSLSLSLLPSGVLLACFLAYATGMTANQAILYVRSKRPNSIQTRSQLSCVREFVQFLAPLRSIFSCAEPRSKPVTLAQYLNRQRHILHGSERKELRHLPKITQLVSKLLLDIVENREVIEEDILEAPDIHDIEMTISLIEQMGAQLSTKEPRLPGMPTLPRHFNEPAIFYHRKSLSYSESDLRRLGSQLNLLTQSLGSLSQDNVGRAFPPSKPVVPAIQCQKDIADVSQGSTSSLWRIKNEENQGEGPLLVRKIKRKTIQRSESVGNSDPAKGSDVLSRWKAEQRDELEKNGMKSQKEESEKSAVPFITLQSELSLEARRLLAAQALAVDLFIEGEEEHKSKVIAWQVSKHIRSFGDSVAQPSAEMEHVRVQAQLNQGGGWERLCVERDPFVLTGLMWSWLEQLKEPVISLQEALALNADTAHGVLGTLGKVNILHFLDANQEKKQQHEMLCSLSRPKEKH